MYHKREEIGEQWKKGFDECKDLVLGKDVRLYLLHLCSLDHLSFVFFKTTK